MSSSPMDLATMVDIASTIINAFWPLLGFVCCIFVGFFVLQEARRIMPDMPDFTRNPYETEEPASDWDDPNLDQETEPENGPRCRYCGKLYDGDETQCKTCGANR